MPRKKSSSEHQHELFLQQIKESLFDLQESSPPYDLSRVNLDKLMAIVNHTYHEFDSKINQQKKLIQLLNDELGECNQIIRTTFERYELSLKASKDGLWDWDYKTGNVNYSGRWKEMMGYSPTANFHSIQDWVDIIHPDYRELFLKELQKHIEGETARFEAEYQIKQFNGEYCWMLAQALVLRDKNGEILRVAGSQTDIHFQKQTENRFVYATYHDALTELPNRFFFYNHLEKFIAQRELNLETHPIDSNANDTYGAVIFLDLDRFKVINDNLGQTVGDNILIAVTHRLKKISRPQDVLARLGGDEFVFLLENVTSLSDAEEIADRISRKLSVPFNIGSERVSVSASIGIVLLSEVNLSVDTILRNANMAMYQAKSLGRRRYSIYNTETHSILTQQFQIEKDLQLAWESNELTLLYQPIVNLSDFSISSFESLLRWEHKTLGTILPSHFIPLAEETGLIIPIGHFVVKGACDQLVEWRKNIMDTNSPVDHKDLLARYNKIGININLSIKQLSDPPTIDAILKLIEQYDLPSCSIKLEITESFLAQNIEVCLEQLKKFKEHKIDLCIDDFGTGFSSLSYLYTFPFDYLKIDKSFIKKITADQKAYRMVAAIINIARDFNYKVVAEGAETLEEIKILRELDCDYAQGYFFSPPVTATQAEELIMNGFPHINLEDFTSRR